MIVEIPVEAVPDLEKGAHDFLMLLSMLNFDAFLMLNFDVFSMLNFDVFSMLYFDAKFNTFFEA